MQKVEEKMKGVDQEIRVLEQKLEKKRSEKKDLELRREDLRMGQDTIVRLSENSIRRISF